VLDSGWQRSEIPRCCHDPFQKPAGSTTSKVPVWSLPPFLDGLLLSTGEKILGFCFHSAGSILQEIFAIREFASRLGTSAGL